MRNAILVLALLALAACGQPGRRGPLQPLFAPSAPADTGEARRLDEVGRLWRDGLYDRARSELDALLAAGCSHPEALLLKARLLLQAGDSEAALPWLDRAAGASPLWAEPRILLAETYLTLERWGAAESVFADVERIAPQGPWGPYGMAAVAARRGDQARAIELCDRALERDPDHLPAVALRARLARATGDAAREEALLGRMVEQQPLEAEAWARLAELADAGNRREDARRRWERAWALAPRPATARALADLAERRGDGDEAARWRTRAGTPPAATDGLTSGETR
jgi:tetratricopeptide (TPR) repeat protein